MERYGLDEGEEPQRHLTRCVAGSGQGAIRAACPLVDTQVKAARSRTRGLMAVARSSQVDTTVSNLTDGSAPFSRIQYRPN